MLANANLGQAHLGFLGKVFHYMYPDFTSKWYYKVGWSLTETMIINAVYPFIDFGIGWATKNFARWRDRGYTKDEYKTRQSNIAEYIELYCGEEYLIHAKYAMMLNITFVSFMYGVGLPIMYPIAALSMFILYSVDRLCIAYFYDHPPSLNDDLTKNFIRLIKYCIIFHLAFGYWMLSNKQIFANIAEFRPTQSAQQITDHYVGWSNI
jgi:hypothetical protein